MVGMFSYIAGGALEGVGNSMVEQARAKREAALEDLRHNRLMEREGMERDYRTNERMASQAFTADQNRQTREASGDLVTLGDGSSGVRSGSTVKPLKDASGKPVRAVGDKSESPADVKAAEWLIKTGVATTPEEAWNKVRAAKSNDNQRAKLVIDTYKTIKEDPTDTRTDAEKRQAAQELVDELISSDEAGGSKAAPKEETAPGTTGDRVTRRTGSTDDEIIKEAKDALAKGVDKDKINSRLRQLGIDPSKAAL